MLRNLSINIILLQCWTVNRRVKKINLKKHKTVALFQVPRCLFFIFVYILMWNVKRNPAMISEYVIYYVIWI